jgi:hypothetical protein
MDAIKISVMPRDGRATLSRPDLTHDQITLSLTSSNLEALAGRTAIASASGCNTAGLWSRFVGFELGTRESRCADYTTEGLGDSSRPVNTQQC